ncbi:unnamed protein product [Rangifer tarandus platyrhynchus]|uniref:Uncharacterized protein n=1 Tax=Rangifer tarandus platyrhynchus TaxID=3082113 RepID=A0ABN8Y5I1_RANTA|nr:unnamed protein product [Rangifer tarandus platyrhynchus]
MRWPQRGTQVQTPGGVGGCSEQQWWGADRVSSDILRPSYDVRVPVSSLLVDPPPKAKDRVPFADVA